MADSDLSAASEVPIVISPRRTLRRGSAGEWMGRTITRRDNVYEIRGQSSSDDEDNVISSHATNLITDLYGYTLKLSAKANTKAERLKYLNIFAIMFTIIAGAVIGVLSIENGNDTTTVSAYIASALGFIITGVHTILSTFPINKRSVLLRSDANRLRKISRQLQMLQASNLPFDEKIRRVETFYAEVDELDLDIFDSKIKSEGEEAQNSKVQTVVNFVRGKSRENNVLPMTMSETNVLAEMSKP